MKEFVIKENDANQRVDKFIQKTMKTMPKSLMYKYIRNKKIKVNNKRCEISQRLACGDTMQCYISEEFYEVEHKMDFLQVPSTLHILYEDDALLIVDKPKGLRAHRDSVDVQDNLADRILHYLYQQNLYDPKHSQSFTPALCHRIDRNTKGIVIAAKTASALRDMNEHIRNHEVHKYYVCIVEGHLANDTDHVILYHKKVDDNTADVIAYPKEGYKEMESAYRTIRREGKYALLEVELMSGKSHQIRAMMAYLKAPLVGDVKYGAQKNGRSDYQQLWAYRIEFHFQKESSLSYLRDFQLQLDIDECITNFHNVIRK